jgi:hypothetical protein
VNVPNGVHRGIFLGDAGCQLFNNIPIDAATARPTDRAFRHSRGLLLRLDSTAAVRESFACKGMSPAGQPEAGLCVSLGRMGNVGCDTNYRDVLVAKAHVFNALQRLAKI